MGDDVQFDAAVRPVGMHLDRQRELTIRWGDGRESRYPLTYLRSKCPCATCRTAGEKPAQGGLSLTILPANFSSRAIANGASLVGSYALQVEWADGHDTGIYDFRYLRAIDPMMPDGASNAIGGSNTADAAEKGR